jgi:hypothetical protein
MDSIDYTEMLMGRERINLLENALRQILVEVGTSTLTNKIATNALEGKKYDDEAKPLED